MGRGASGIIFGKIQLSSDSEPIDRLVDTLKGLIKEIGYPTEEGLTKVNKEVLKEEKKAEKKEEKPETHTEKMANVEEEVMGMLSEEMHEEN